MSPLAKMLGKFTYKVMRKPLHGHFMWRGHITTKDNEGQYQSKEKFLKLNEFHFIERKKSIIKAQ